MTPEQFEKLPKFAKDEIFKLQQQVKSLTAESEAWAYPETTPIHWEMVLDKHGIPPRASVVFTVGEHGRKIEVSLRDGRLNIYGSHTLLVIPDLSNTLWIGLAK